ncbi:serine carboxypeptidase-like 45 [Silene latifolia]|uniref:serine carboxypeptidase-like 45 n=1 Tax=Silene latifolia TaxID=37657 RepID=UPI003D788B88
MSPITWLIVISTLMHYVTSYPETELIKTLPQQPAVNFKQFAGYVTVDEAQQRHLFYYFVEAETNPQSKPLVLWLNGGPGCSSVGYGAFMEHGPFRPTENGLVVNEYSWNKEANMLYLETPVGVGFSYSSNKSFYKSVNDEITAKDNLVFLQKWLTKFFEYKKSDLFITGESYAESKNDETGHYVPQLAELILKTNLQTNLKGIALGNPLLEFNTDFNSRGEYLWSHGIISDATYDLLQNVCNYSQILRRSFKQALTPECRMVKNKMDSQTTDYLNLYDVIVDVCLHEQTRFLTALKDDKIDPCQDDKTTNYLNKQEVQKALHAQLVGVTKWSLRSSVVNYTADDAQVSTLPLLANLMKLGVRILLYR